jgi:hypothetical protein
LTPFYPGQPGVPGTDHTRGLRLDSNGKIIWVDPNHVDPNDQRDGTNPDSPMRTVAAALTKCRAYMGDVIVVAPNSYWTYSDTSAGRATPVAEEVTVTVPGVRIVGLFPSGQLGVPWVPVTDNGVCITVHAMDVLVEGFCFWDNQGLTAPVAIRAEWDTPINYGENLTVRHCWFGDGMSYGVQLDYSWNAHIHDNIFQEVAVAAIQSMDVEGDPDYAVIHDNLFMNSGDAIDLEDVSECMIYRNAIFGDDGGTNNFIDLTGGSNNMVFDNWLGCTLAAAGFDTPGKIERATDRELKGSAGLSQAELKRARAVFPKR